MHRSILLGVLYVVDFSIMVLCIVELSTMGQSVTATTFRIFRLDALALSVIATTTWLGGWLAGWVAGCHTPELYQNR